MRRTTSAAVGSLLPSRDRRGARFRLDEERSFSLRLLGTLVLTLILVSAVGYELRSGPLESRVIQDALDEVEAEAATLRHTYTAHDEQMMRLLMAQAVVEGIGAKPGVLEAELLDHQGLPVVLTAPGADHGMVGGTEAPHGPMDIDGPTVRRPGLHGSVEFFVPLELPDGRFVLHVARDRTSIDEQLGALQRYSLLVVSLGVPFGIAVFYLLGGRTLSVRHRRALARSLRDGLTGLGNHRAYQEDLRRALGHADRHGEPVCLLLLDLDDFKRINDRTGHGRGDQLLVLVAGLLAGSRTEDRAFRIGGDEFALVLSGADDAAAMAVGERIRRAIEVHSHGATASIGVARYEPGIAADEFGTRADLALYEAKHRGRNAVVSFSEIDGSSEVVDASQRAALERILCNTGVEAAFQPIWDLSSGRLIGQEALARLPAETPLQGPAHAFAVAEQLDRTVELDSVCRRAVLRSVGALPEGTLLFLNLAPQVLGHQSIAGDALARQVRAAGLEPMQVVIEITERGAIDRQLVAAEVARLRQMGFKLAIDDVGTGDAGLEVLGQVAVDFLKIDRSIVVGAQQQSTARAVLMAVLVIGSATGATIIAEGIESEELLEFVRNPLADMPTSKVHAAQGYHLGRPGPIQQSSDRLVAGGLRV